MFNEFKVVKYIKELKGFIIKIRGVFKTQASIYDKVSL